MPQILPRLSIKVNTDPGNDAAGYIASYDLHTFGLYGADKPATGYTARPNLVRMQCLDSIIPVFSAREVAGSFSPRTLLRTGYGVRLRFDVFLEFLTGWFPAQALSGTEMALAELVGHMARSSPGYADAEARYFWLSPNTADAAMQWIRMEPEEGPEYGYGPDGTLTRTLRISFVSALLYKSITWAYTRPVAGDSCMFWYPVYTLTPF
jgi:hypothetical protein